MSLVTAGLVRKICKAGSLTCRDWKQLMMISLSAWLVLLLKLKHDRCIGKVSKRSFMQCVYRVLFQCRSKKMTLLESFTTDYKNLTRNDNNLQNNTPLESICIYWFDCCWNVEELQWYSCEECKMIDPLDGHMFRKYDWLEIKALAKFRFCYFNDWLFGNAYGLKWITTMKSTFSNILPKTWLVRKEHTNNHCHPHIHCLYRFSFYSSSCWRWWKFSKTGTEININQDTWLAHKTGSSDLMNRRHTFTQMVIPMYQDVSKSTHCWDVGLPDKDHITRN